MDFKESRVVLRYDTKSKIPKIFTKEFLMKKSLLAVVILLLSKQIFACDYYEDESVLKEILKTGIYKSNVSGKVCSYDKKSVIPIKRWKSKW